jgi:PAS domain S-box-containing protein
VYRVRWRPWQADGPSLTGFTTTVVGGLILFGWAFHIPLLTTILPGHPATTPITAIAFILAGASLGLLKRAESDGRARAAVRASGLAVTAIGLLTLLGYAVGWNFEVGTRPALSSAASFVVVGVVLVLLSTRRPRPTAAAQLLILPVMFVALAGFAGNLLGATTPSFLTSEPMDSGFPTAILFLLLSRGLLERYPQYGLMTVVEASRPGGIVARRLLIAFTWISLGLGWLFLRGHRSGLYEDDLLVTLFVVSNIALTSLVVWQSARSMNRADAKQQRAEEELRSANAERQRRAAVIESVLESIGDGVVIADERGGRIYNLAAKRLLGMDVSEVPPSELAKRYSAYFPDQKTPYPTSEFPIARALRGEVLEETDVFLRHPGAPDGRWVTISAQPLRDAAGQSQGAVAILRDITARRHTEEARRRLAAIVEASDDAIFSTDGDAKITDWNRGAERLYGYAEIEVLGRNITLLAPLGQADEIPEILQRIKVGQRIDPYETVRRRKDGETVDVSITISPVYDSGGAIVGASAIARDISERRRTEAEIRRLNTDLERRVAERTADLEAANKDLEAFTYSVSHDLRAPLRAIHGFVQLLTQRHAAQLDADAKRYLERVSAGATQMARLIDDLLALSHVGRRPLEAHTVATSEVVRRALDQLAPQMEGRAVELSVGKLPECLAEPILLEQVFVNLIGNALKYSRGRDPARIEIGSQPDATSEQSIFFVKDNGVGFDMRYVQKLFGVFQRLHRAEDYEGTGVGLAIVQRIITRHGGRVWAEAQPDKGASFYFTLGGATAWLPTAA